jgi:hypothetical protein
MEYQQTQQSTGTLVWFWENIGQEYPSIILPYRVNAMINIMVYPDPVYTSAAATAPPSPPSPPPDVIIMVSDDSDVDDDEEYSSMSIAKGGVACPFPWKLHQMLDTVEREGLQSIVSWQPHGKSFLVHRPADFTSLILPRYVRTYGRTVLDFFACFFIPSNSRRFSCIFCFSFFTQTKYASFQRQLNMYGFHRFSHGKDKGAYFHSCMVRGQPQLVRGMVRCKIKGTKVRRALSAHAEPNFYAPSLSSFYSTNSVTPPPAPPPHNHHQDLHSMSSLSSSSVASDDSSDASSSCSSRVLGSPVSWKNQAEVVPMQPLPPPPSVCFSSSTTLHQELDNHNYNINSNNNALHCQLKEGHHSDSMSIHQPNDHHFVAWYDMPSMDEVDDENNDFVQDCLFQFLNDVTTDFVY